MEKLLFSDKMYVTVSFLQRTFQEGLQTIGQLQLGNPRTPFLLSAIVLSSIFFLHK